MILYVTELISFFVAFGGAVLLWSSIIDKLRFKKITQLETRLTKIENDIQTIKNETKN